MAISSLYFVCFIGVQIITNLWPQLYSRCPVFRFVEYNPCLTKWRKTHVWQGKEDVLNTFWIFLAKLGKMLWGTKKYFTDIIGYKEGDKPSHGLSFSQGNLLSFSLLSCLGFIEDKSVNQIHNFFCRKRFRIVLFNSRLHFFRLIYCCLGISWWIKSHKCNYCFDHFYIMKLNANISATSWNF